LNDLIVLSPCFYQNTEPADLMVRTARANGLHVELYGVQWPFIPHGADAQVAKLYELMVLRQKLADYVLITDCRDVLFLAGEQEILEKFTKCGFPVLMSTERYCWPPEQEIVEFFYPTGYANAGQYIGTWEYVQLCLKHLLDKYRGVHPGADNSQGWWMWAKMRGELNFDMDAQSQIFQSLSGGEEMQIAGTRVQNPKTKSFPCSLHFNGNPGNDGPQKEMYRRLFG
jgi:hypothetical protein